MHDNRRVNQPSCSEEVDPAELQALAHRAVGVVVDKHVDPDLLVVTRRRLPKPPRAARILTDLENAADGRTTLLMVGLRDQDLPGLTTAPSASWFDEVREEFPDLAPKISWAMIDYEGVQLLAVTTDRVDQAIGTYDRGQVAIPRVDEGHIVTTSEGAQPQTRTSWKGVPTGRVLGGWIERNQAERGDVSLDVYRGRVEIELEAAPGTMADSDCSATLLLPDHRPPIEFDVEVHPANDDAGVTRHDGGITVRATLRAELYMAAAVRSDGSPDQIGSARLVVSLLLPGRATAELRSLLLSPDPDSETQRWVI